MLADSMRRLFGLRGRGEERGRRALELAAARGRALLEGTREPIVALDDEDTVVAANRPARDVAGGGRLVGDPLPDELAETARALASYPAGDGEERLVSLESSNTPDTYEELRIGFTAAVSHELRTPLARVLALLESAELAGADPLSLAREARAHVEEIRELVDDVLFLSELETGVAVVALGSTPAGEVVAGVLDSLRERAERAGVNVTMRAGPDVRLPLRPRMLAVVVENLVANAIRYAGPGTACEVVVDPGSLCVTDDGHGVAEDELARLFERFYRGDRARASRGTGLGLAIVKHVVMAAGGTVAARSGPRGGLQVECRFPQT